MRSFLVFSLWFFFVITDVIIHFLVIPQIHLFSSKKQFKLKTKKNPKNNNSKKRMFERPENG